MGLIRAALGAAGGVMADQWKEYFYCESIPENVMAVKGLHRISGRSSNYKGSENIISNGSVIAVADGQCMIIVDQGKVTELCAEPGEFVDRRARRKPSIFSGRPRHKHPHFNYCLFLCCFGFDNTFLDILVILRIIFCEWNI